MRYLNEERKTKQKRKSASKFCLLAINDYGDDDEIKDNKNNNNYLEYINDYCYFWVFGMSVVVTEEDCQARILQILVLKELKEIRTHMPTWYFLFSFLFCKNIKIQQMLYPRIKTIIFWFQFFAFVSFCIVCWWLVWISMDGCLAGWLTDCLPASLVAISYV